MSQVQKPGPTATMTRREWLTLSLAATVSGCGGGAENSASTPGTGGTGIFASGPISGFGSVIVNGVRFDDRQANVSIEGQNSVSNALRLGMIVSLVGQRDLATGVGSASRIDVWAIAQGPVSSVVGTQFSVAGMTIQTDGGTVFGGVASVSAITSGLLVRVWGLQASTDGSQWTATRVEVSAEPDLISSGVCAMADSSYFVNGLRLYSPSSYNLQAGTLVCVQGAASPNGSVVVNAVRSLEPSAYAANQGAVELSGLVTAALSSQQFVLGNVTIDARLATFTDGGFVTRGGRVRVKGVWDGKLIRASAIEREDDQSLARAEIDAPIQEFISIADFVVRGQHCDGSGLTQIQGGSIADLKVGLKIHVVGVKRGEILYLNQLKIGN